MKSLSIIDAAKYLGRSTKTVRNYIKSGKLNAVMEDSPFGHRYVIPLEELQKMKDGDCPSDVKPVESILEVIQPNLPLEPVENMVIGVEKRLLEAMESRMEALEERLAERDRLLMETLERMEAKKINRPRRAAVLPYSSTQNVNLLHQLFSYPFICLFLRQLSQANNPGAAFFITHSSPSAF